MRATISFPRHSSLIGRWLSSLRWLPACLALFVACVAPASAESDAAGSYVFNTGTTLLGDMSGATTEVVAANGDDQGSAVTDIGFDFFFQGTLYQQFSVNSNGLLKLGGDPIQGGGPYLALGQSGQALISAFAADQRTHATGKVHYKLKGAAPNRSLIVEWRNMQSRFPDMGSADLTYQVQLYETSGIIVLAYGSMTMGAALQSDAGSKNVHIGFSSGNTAGAVASIAVAQSGTPVPAVDAASATAVVNSYAPGAIPGLTGRYLRFIPPTPTVPTGISFSGVSQSAMTLNWTDSANEQAYAIYHSRDTINFVLHGVAARNATAYSATGLTPGTVYQWRVYAVSEGALSPSALTGQQGTLPATTQASAQSGNWSDPGTWVSGIPTVTDDVAIQPGHTVTIDTSPTVNNVNIKPGAVLQFEQSTSRTLTTMLDVVVESTGKFATQPTGIAIGHRVQIYRSLINQGTIDFAASVVSKADIVFNGPFDGAMAISTVTNLRSGGGVIISKLVAATRPTIHFSNKFGVVSVDGVYDAGFLVVNSGTFRIAEAFLAPFSLFAVSPGFIPAAGGVWMDADNRTIAAQGSSLTVAGLLRLSAGTWKVGTAADESLVLAPGAELLVSGGTLAVAGRLGVASATDTISVTQTGGLISVAEAGNSSPTSASLDYGTNASTLVSHTGGTAKLKTANSSGMGPGDYRSPTRFAPGSTVNGTVVFGSEVSGAAKVFRASGHMPDIVIDNQSAGHTLALQDQGGGSPNRVNDVLIKPGTTLNAGTPNLLINGATFTNDGTLNPSTAILRWVRQGTPQKYTGSGVVAPRVSLTSVENPGGSLTIDPASPNIAVSTFWLVDGDLINTGKITLGSGDASLSQVQVGGAFSPSSPGTFDAPFTLNLGTGGLNVFYLATKTARTTGPEIPLSRTLAKLSYNDSDPTHSLTIAGGGLNLTGTADALLLTNGRIVVGAADALTLTSPTATVQRTNGWVDGTLKKTFGAAGSKTFEVGTTNGYSPVTVNATAGTFPADFSVRAIEGIYPNFNASPLALKRHWYLSPVAITADLTFNWRDPADLPAAAPESALVLYNQNGAITTPGGTVNAAANTATITGVTSFAAWTLAAPVDMSINKSHVGSAFTKGQNGAQYLLKVTNGPAPVPDGTVITVKDTLPAPLTFASATGSGWTCGAVGQDVTCTITQTAGAPFGAGAQSVITLAVNVAANAPATLVNTATCDCSVTAAQKNASSVTVTVNPSLGTGIALTVTKAGSGLGSVGDAGNTINCGTFCAQNYPAGTTVTLTATPQAGSIFTGWTGACTGTASCVVTVNAPTGVSATFAPASIGVKILDVDQNNKYEALYDGILILRYLFGIRGDLLIGNVVGTGANRSTVDAITSYLADVTPLLDIDGNGKPDALTDGITIIRYLFSIGDDNLIQNANGPNATRATAAAVRAYLDTLKP